MRKPRDRADADRTTAADPGRPAARAQRAHVVRIARTAGLPAAGIAATIAVWWSATIVLDIRPIFLPAPPDVVAAFRDRPDHLLAQAQATLFTTLSGFAAATVGGVILAVAVTASDTVNRALLPQIVAVNAIPKVAIAPLLIVWVGYGASARVLLAFLISFFPIVVSTMAGLTSVPVHLSELTRSLSASRWQTLTRIRFPWAMPQIFVGLRLGITLAVIGTVVAEMQVPNAGLGATIKIASASSDMPRAFAAIIILMFMSATLFYAVVAAERLLLPWARATSS